jgi:glutamine synthetase
LLEHARAACVFTTPTLNGYKRYRPYSLAPDRILWGADNRGAMLRVIGGHGDPDTRVENRAGEPAANPYLYLASQIYAGLDGLAAGREPATAADTPYDTKAEGLPDNLIEAVDALDASAMYRQRMGDEFVDYLVHIKRAEIKRFFREVTDFEQREYFSVF